MNNWMQVLKVALFLGGFYNSLGRVQNATVRKRFDAQGRLGAENEAGFVRSRRMMMGLGSEATQSNDWGYLNVAMENPSGFTNSLPKFKRSKSATTTSKLSVEQSDIVLRRSHKSSFTKRAVSQAANAALLHPHIVLGQGHRAVKPRSLKPEFQISKESKKLSDIVLRNRARSLKAGSLKLAATGASKSSESDIVLRNRARSLKAGSLKLAATGASKSSESDIVLRNRTRSLKARFLKLAATGASKTRESDIVLRNRARSLVPRFLKRAVARVSKIPVIQSDIVLLNRMRSLKARSPERAEPEALEQSSLPEDIALGHGQRSPKVKASKRTISGASAPSSTTHESEIHNNGQRLVKSGSLKRALFKASGPSTFREDIVLENNPSAFKAAALKRSVPDDEETSCLRHGIKKSDYLPGKNKKGCGTEHLANSASAPTNVPKNHKRNDLGLMPKNFVKPLPIFDEFEK